MQTYTLVCTSRDAYGNTIAVRQFQCGSHWEVSSVVSSWLQVREGETFTFDVQPIPSPMSAYAGLEPIAVEGEIPEREEDEIPF